MTFLNIFENLVGTKPNPQSFPSFPSLPLCKTNEITDNCSLDKLNMTELPRSVKVHYVYNPYAPDYSRGTKGVITIVCQKMRLSDKPVYMYGFSLCRPKDNFEKSRGRALAFERMIKDSTDTNIYRGNFEYVGNPKFRKIKALLLSNILINNRDSLPDWARNNVTAELKTTLNQNLLPDS